MSLRVSLGWAARHLGRLLACALVYAAGLVLSRIVFLLLGIRAPRLAAQADEGVAGYYLFAGSFALTSGLLPLAGRLAAGWRGRWLVLAWFLLASFAVGNPLEDAIYSSAEGLLWMVPVLVLPCALLAGALALLWAPRSAPGAGPGGLGSWRAGWPPARCIPRILAAVVAFPAVYFGFGIIASPLVAEYYRDGVAGLALPAARVILGVELLRGLLFALAVLPVIRAWCGSRRELVRALGLALFVLGATFEIVLAYQLPLVLRVTHTVEILADSLVYAWVLVSLLAPCLGSGLEEPAR
ncbi:MAG: hypothetical protein AB1505_27060 [Candidatus Latescibacterota bacterium]